MRHLTSLSIPLEKTEKFNDRKIICCCRPRPENLSVTKSFGRTARLSHKAFRITLIGEISWKLILDAVMRTLSHQHRKNETAFDLVATVTRNESYPHD